MTILVTKAMRRNGLGRSQKTTDAGAAAETGMGDEAKRKESVAFGKSERETRQCPCSLSSRGICPLPIPFDSVTR